MRMVEAIGLYRPGSQVFGRKLYLIDTLTPFVPSQVFLVFCAFQALLHKRQSARGAIALN